MKQYFQQQIEAAQGNCLLYYLILEGPSDEAQTLRSCRIPYNSELGTVDLPHDLEYVYTAIVPVFRKRKDSFSELIKSYLDLGKKINAVWETVWAPKFKAANSLDEFNRLCSLLTKDAGVGSPGDLPGLIPVYLALESARIKTDGYRNNQSKD